MRIKSTSRNLKRTVNADVYALKYHDTTVFEFNRSTNQVTLRTGGWNTMNTARAIDIAFEEIGVKAFVEYRNNKKEKGLFLNINGNRVRVTHGMTVEINS